MTSHSESNSEKSRAGKELQDQLVDAFNVLIDQNIILNFESNKNFKHEGFSYQKPYLINFLIETLDNKFILINSSNSFRNDRFKQQAYDIQGVLNNSDISSNIIASILLYPDSEINNKTFVNFREKVNKGEAYSPASHLLTISEFYEFLENHKASVEAEMNEIKEINETTQIKDGSYYGKAGNELEREVVKILNNTEHLEQYKNNKCEEVLFNSVIDQLCSQGLNKESIISIASTNTVKKLAKGGNAKTDVIIEILTNDGKQFIETISIKKSKENVVSCHDYKYDDFVRVLNIENTKLAEYFKLFQAYPTYGSFEENLPHGYSFIDFEEELVPYREKFAQWVLTGEHDDLNLVDPTTQISKYLLIVTNNKVFCSDFINYIDTIFTKAYKKFGLPFRWTFPSGERGNRIQLKMPIIIN